MNQRIRELAAQASADSMNEKLYQERVLNRALTEAEYSEIYDRKFSQLIVWECARSVNDWYQNHDRIQADPMSWVLAHFGVDP